MKVVTKNEKVKIALESLRSYFNDNKDKVTAKDFETLDKAETIFNEIKDSKEFECFIKYYFDKHSDNYRIFYSETLHETIRFVVEIIKNFEGKEEAIKENEEKNEVKKAKIKEIAGEGFWNGKIYGSSKTGYSIYVANKKYTITDEDYLILK